MNISDFRYLLSVLETRGATHISGTISLTRIEDEITRINPTPTALKEGQIETIDLNHFSIFQLLTSIPGPTIIDNRHFYHFDKLVTESPWVTFTEKSKMKEIEEVKEEVKNLFIHHLNKYFGPYMKHGKMLISKHGNDDHDTHTIHYHWDTRNETGTVNQRQLYPHGSFVEYSRHVPVPIHLSANEYPHENFPRGSTCIPLYFNKQTVLEVLESRKYRGKLSCPTVYDTVLFRTSFLNSTNAQQNTSKTIQNRSRLPTVLMNMVEEYAISEVEVFIHQPIETVIEIMRNSPGVMYVTNYGGGFHLETYYEPILGSSTRQTKLDCYEHGVTTCWLEQIEYAILYHNTGTHHLYLIGVKIGKEWSVPTHGDKLGLPIATVIVPFGNHYIDYVTKNIWTNWVKEDIHRNKVIYLPGPVTQLGNYYS